MKVQNPNMMVWLLKETPKEISEAGPVVLMRLHLDKMNWRRKQVLLDAEGTILQVGKVLKGRKEWQ